MKEYKRKWREISDEHREKIRQANLNKHKSYEHRLHISRGMREYWKTVPHRPEDIDN